MKKGKALRLTALILCVVMLMTMLTACAKKEEPVKEDENTEETEEKPNDFKTIYEYYPVDRPVMKIGDVEINWGLFYFCFYQEVTKLNATNTVLDWTAEYGSTGMSYIAYAASEAIYNSLRRYAGIEHFSKEYGVTLTEEQEAQYNADRESDVELFEGEDAMLEYMDSKFLDDSVAEYMAKSEYLYANLMDYVVGENGEKLEEDEILALANTAYKMVKVIPFPISDEDGNPVGRDEKENQLERAETCLAGLEGLSGQELSDSFDYEIGEYAEGNDDELMNGYVFARGKFDSAVEKAVKDIAEGELYDGVIEGSDNYYIAMRIPVDVEAYPYTIKTGFGDENLRSLYKDDIFNNKFWDWADNAEVEFYPELTDVDINAIIGW
jgi:hypothetical protein